jgi:ribosomal protein L40E
MNANGTGSYEEHHFRKVIPGNIETVRQRLSDTLEDFNYMVISESPLQAKRVNRRNIMTANVLEYDARLTIGLKAISPASTLATFDYTVEYLFSKGERLTLEREADAMIAMVTAPLNKTICSACETENLGAVRFCRVCGTPILRSKLPAELEVMRLMGGTSASEVEILWGVALMVFTLMLTMPMIWFGKPKLAVIGWILFALGELLGTLCLAYGMRRLHKTVNPGNLAQPEMPFNTTRAISTQEPTAITPEPERLALQPQPISVTEGTTELIEQSHATPLQVKQARTTDSME